MRFAVMIEGQEGVGWDDWLALAETCERTGIEALFRSDHYLSVEQGHDLGALDAWGTICALATVTETLRLGTLVSPATFRHPSNLAKLAVTADHISGGRVELGLGTGWHDAEHRAYGCPDPSFGRLAEQVEVVHGILSPGPFSFSGEHYELRGCRALPKPLSRPNLIVGGSARRGTVEPAVRFADEYNTTFASPEECRRRRAAVDEATELAGRDPLTFSLMTPCVVGADRAEVEERVRRLGPKFREGPQQIVGTVEEVAARLREYEDAGVERVMLQHLAHDDVEMVELLGREVAPRVR